MSDVVAAVSSARKRVDDAAGRHARAQAQEEAAAADAARILKLMLEEFNVSSVSAARDLLDSFESQIQEQVTIIEAALSESEGANGD